MSKPKEIINPCPVKEALKIIGGKWRLQIIFVIGDNQIRFGNLKRLIPAISEKVLIQELKFLVAEGILTRKAYNEIPPRVEYGLTEFGTHVLPIIQQLGIFGIEVLKKSK